MGNNVPGFRVRANEKENRNEIHVAAGSKEEAQRIFFKLLTGGEVEAPLDGGAEGTCFGMFRDWYGIERVVEFNPCAQDAAQPAEPKPDAI